MLAGPSAGCRDEDGSTDERGVTSEPTGSTSGPGPDPPVTTTGDPADTSTTAHDSSGGSSSASESAPASSTGPSGETSGTEGTGGSSSGSEGSSSESGSGREGSESGSSSEGGREDSEGGSSGESDDCSFTESFEGLPDGSDWPAPWTATGGVLIADVQGGRGRLVPVPGPYALARMYAPIACPDVEGTMTFELTDEDTQGVGLYLRQNDGYLQETMPPGQGYVAFSQSLPFSEGIAVWRELDGEEILLAPTTPVTIQAGVIYIVRFRITQLDAVTTRLQARVWPEAQLEPLVWHVDVTDDAPSLQSFAGGVSIDAWSELGAGMPSDLFVDDIVVTAAP